MAHTALQVGSREVLVDAEPLPGCGGANFRDKALSRSNEAVFVVRPSLGYRLFGLIFVLVGAVPLAIALILHGQHGNKTEHWVLGGFGLLFFLIGLAVILGTRRHRFDKNDGTLRILSLFRNRTIPLS